MSDRIRVTTRRSRPATSHGLVWSGRFASIVAIAATVASLGSLLMASSAMATNPLVYHSPTGDGSDPGTPWNVSGGTATLDLWIAPGPETSQTGEGEQVCLDGSGDEICGFTIEIVTIGSMEMNDFFAENASDLVYNFEPPGSLRINRVSGIEGDVDPVRLGQLIVTTSPGTGYLFVSPGSEAVAADLRVIGVDDYSPMAVPEPGAGLGLIAGSILLGLLARRRLSGARLAATSALLVACLAHASAASATDDIDFENGYADDEMISTIATATNELTITGHSPIKVAEVGGPVTAFEPADTPSWFPNTGSFFITDSTGQGSLGQKDRYDFSFETPVSQFWLLLFDYRPEGAPPFEVLVGAKVHLRAYRDYAGTQLVGETEVVLDGQTPTPDGHTLSLHVKNLPTEVRALSLTFTGDDITTGVGSIGFETVTDPDFDGHYGTLDNCPDLYNASQSDKDGDGVGDYCDNCNLFANASQNDGDNNGVGDACDPPRLISRNVGDQSAPLFEIFLECNAIPIAEVNFGLLVPFSTDPLEANFGGDVCNAPVFPPPGVPVGTGCVANPDIGTNIDPGLSGQWGQSLGVGPPYHQRANYVNLVGNGVDQRICDPFESPVYLGRFRVDTTIGFDGDGAFIFDGLPDQGTPIVVGTEPYDGPVETFSLTSTTSPPPAPELEILLQPAAGEDADTAKKWALCIGAGTAKPMHRVTIGFHIEGASTSDIQVIGCDGMPDAEGIRECNGVGPRVSDAGSFVAGPYPTAAPPRAADVMYVVLEGGWPYPNAPTLNPVAGDESCIATISVDSPPGTPGIAPALITDGVAVMPFTGPETEAFITSTPGLEPLLLQEIALVNDYDTGEDYDSDGHLDSADNCVFQANDLKNNGDFLSSTVDFDDDGDSCECADGNGSGATFPSDTPDPVEGTKADLLKIREYLVGLSGDSSIAAVCSVAGSPDCDTQDAIVLERALSGFLPGIERRCDAALPD